MRTKVDARLVERARNGVSEPFFVELREQADLSGATALATKQEKGRYVFERLREVAARTQPAVERAIRDAGFETVPYYIINTILAVPRSGGAVSLAQLAALAEREDVERLAVVERAGLLPEVTSPAPEISSDGDLPPNLQLIGGSHLAARGIDGRGLVVGISDTGVDWTHPAIQTRYRGFSEAGATHHYNWFDPTLERSPVAVDTNGHGTHVTAIITGGAPGERVGVAPGAQWIGCRGTGPGSNRETVLACLQFFLAPTDVSGNNPSPDLAPDITNHSYICPFCGLEGAFQALKDAGVAVVAASGNFGPTCGSVFDPGTYANVLSVGAVDNSGVIAEFSSRGPVEEIAVKPEIVAPGVNIRSATLAGAYENVSGTSQAAPHVAGAMALILQAHPELLGDVDATVALLLGLATTTSADDCAGTPAAGSNNMYGYGVLNLDRLHLTARRRAVRK